MGTSRAHCALLATVLVCGAFGYACSSGDSSDGTGGSSQGGSAGNSNAGSAGNAGSGVGGFSGSAGTSGSGGGGGVDLCGGTPCANHTGTKEFNEPSAPTDPGSVFGGSSPNPPGTATDQEPKIVYPSHETMFPINVSRIRHEWAAGGTNDLFKLEFVGPNTSVTVYTGDTNWLPTEEEWDWIAESNRGGSVTWTVTALDQAAPSASWQSTPITLLFSAAEVQGALYYWSTGTEGVMRAVVSDPIPVKFYTDPMGDDADTCVACHTLSRDGKRMAVGYGGEKLREVSVPDRVTLVPTNGQATRDMSWSTFSPDGKLLLIAAKGKLTLIDADTGLPVGPNNGEVAIPSGTVANHPDWNAKGDMVAVALGTGGGGKSIDGGGIALLPYNSGAWGAAQVIVPSSGKDDNNFFPSWSPDGQWIVYVHAEGASKDATTATLKLVAGTGGTPITLTRVNERVNNEDGVIDIGNSMPTWAPSTKPGIFWIAYSSLRAYATLRPQDDKEDQIWIAAIDPTLSTDKSYSGFWAPFQSIEEGNHRAFWTVSDTDTQCLCVDICGDNLDNDCNGVADPSDCVECGPKEICGNGIDDDCDCVVDECNDEICDNGIDDDGDGLVDENDPSCQGPK